MTKGDKDESDVGDVLADYFPILSGDEVANALRSRGSARIKRVSRAQMEEEDPMPEKAAGIVTTEAFTSKA